MGNCNTFGTQSKMCHCLTTRLVHTCSGQVARWVFVRQNTFKPLKTDPSSKEKKWSKLTTFLLALLAFLLTRKLTDLYYKSVPISKLA